MKINSGDTSRACMIYTAFSAVPDRTTLDPRRQRIRFAYTVMQDGVPLGSLVVDVTDRGSANLAAIIAIVRAIRDAYDLGYRVVTIRSHSTVAVNAIKERRDGRSGRKKCEVENSRRLIDAFYLVADRLDEWNVGYCQKDGNPAQEALNAARALPSASD